MLILVLIDVQYSQKGIFNFEKGTQLKIEEAFVSFFLPQIFCLINPIFVTFNLHLFDIF